jgi:hypothetical protein
MLYKYLYAKKKLLDFQEQKLYEVIKDTKTPFFTNYICEMFPELEKQRKLDVEVPKNKNI